MELPLLVLLPELVELPLLVLLPELVELPLLVLLPELEVEPELELDPEPPEDEDEGSELLLQPPNAKLAANTVETTAAATVRGVMRANLSNGCARPVVTRERHRMFRRCFMGYLRESSWIPWGPRAGWNCSPPPCGPLVARAMHLRRDMTCGCRHARHTGENGSPPSGTHATRRWSIDVSTGRSSARVELPKLVAVRVEGIDMVPLDALWSASRLGSLVGLCFDFLADDGFRITSRQPAGIDGTELRTGYVCLGTRDLVWPPFPERPCFWRVKGVARVVGTARKEVRGVEPGVPAGAHR